MTLMSLDETKTLVCILLPTILFIVDMVNKNKY